MNVPTLRILNSDTKFTAVKYESSHARSRMLTTSLKKAYQSGKINLANPEKLDEM